MFVSTFEGRHAVLQCGISDKKGASGSSLQPITGQRENQNLERTQRRDLKSERDSQLSWHVYAPSSTIGRSTEMGHLFGFPKQKQKQVWDKKIEYPECVVENHALPHKNEKGIEWWDQAQWWMYSHENLRDATYTYMMTQLGESFVQVIRDAGHCGRRRRLGEKVKPRCHQSSCLIPRYWNCASPPWSPQEH